MGEAIQGRKLTTTFKWFAIEFEDNAMTAWRVDFLRFILIGLVLMGLSESAASERPNILYLYADDLGWGAIGPNGQGQRRAEGLPNVLTPNLDRLSERGVNFTRSYGCTVCSPARSSQQTGFHQGHTFADRNDPDNAKKAIRADDLTMGELLAKAGYITGYWGKWGYGASKDQQQPQILNVQTLPTSHGYQHVLAELHHVRAHTFFQPSLWRAPAAEGSLGGLELVANSLRGKKAAKEFPDYPSLLNHETYPDPAYCDDSYALAALEFVRQNAKAYHETGRPFFGLFAAQIPHAPFQEITKLPAWSDAYQDKPWFESLSNQAKAWAAMVTRLDGHIGNLLDALEDPNGDGDRSDSIVENTLVVFQSDNGGPQHDARVAFDANGKLRGRKGQIFEGGIRVPTLISWPKWIHRDSALKPGSMSEQVIDVSDLLPTFCELAGVEAPVGLDGVSIAPTLLGRGIQRDREFLIHEAGKSQSIIRGRYKLIRSPAGLQLFDLIRDAGETTNIAASHPERVKRLNALLVGERVTEPKGFANTYHHWIGPRDGDAGEAQHWSDYVYENKGVEYQVDQGAPRNSWIASLRNTSLQDQICRVSRDLAFLGLSIQGAIEGSARQFVEVEENVTLNARNELRIGFHGSLLLRGGAIESLRWIDVRNQARLEGWGEVRGQLYNDGRVSVEGGPSGMIVSGDYVESSGATLSIGGSDDNFGRLGVKGAARLAGRLEVQLNAGFVPVAGKVIPVLSASKLSGRFSNDRDIVVTPEGVRFRIAYIGNQVRLFIL